VYSSVSPSTNEDEEQALLEKVPPGLGFYDYEVPFTYQEHGTSKSELVKLRLCLRCAPLLFRTKDPIDYALAARRARMVFEPSIDIEHGRGKTRENFDVKYNTNERKGNRRRRYISSESSCSSDERNETTAKSTTQKI
jgi:hypothetical protein